MKERILLLALGLIVFTTITHAQGLTVDAGPDLHKCFPQQPGSVITPTITGGAGPYTYQWTPSTGLNSTIILNPFANPTVTTVYYLTVTGSSGTGTDSMTFYVHGTPTVDAGPDQEICLGDSVQLDAEVSGNSTASAYTFIWTPGQTLNDSTLEDPLASPSASTVYTVVATSNFGCGSAADSANVFLLPSPIAEAGQADLICAGDSIQLNGSFYYTSSPQAPPNQVLYAWTPSTTINDTTLASPMAAPTSSGYYYLQVSHNQCSTVDSVLVTVLPPPATGIQIQSDSLVALNTTGGGSYQWYRDSIAIPGATNPVYVPTQTGCFYFTADEGFCSFQSDTICLVPLSANSSVEPSHFSLSFNPASGQYFLLNTQTSGKAFRIELIDLNGRVLKESNIPFAPMVDLTDLMSGLKTGMYLLRIHQGKGLLPLGMKLLVR